MASTGDIESQHVKDQENLPLKERLKSMFQTIELPLTSKCCIFRVPDDLRMIKEAAYTPRVISIGPFHHKRGERLRLMEKQKVRYLDYYIQHQMVSLDELLTFVRDAEKRVRQSYGEHVELSSDDFVMMVLLDGLFIIEYFRRWCYPESRDENDEVFYNMIIENSIFNDLILLENQLPFFVLESLYNHIFADQSSELPFLAMSLQFFSLFNPQKITQVQVLHFTDLMRTFHLHSSSARKPGPKDSLPSYTAKELEECGINFQVKSSKSLLDIEFMPDDGVFHIPQLEIDDGTELVFRNIMALEQCLYNDKTYICDYVELLDTLIDTSKDVELLVRKGIIINDIGDHEQVAKLFNNLNLGTVRSAQGFYFYKLNQDLDKYYKKTWHKWRASLIREYFSTPWQIASVVAATTLIILTLLQTIKAF